MNLVFFLSALLVGAYTDALSCHRSSIRSNLRVSNAMQHTTSETIVDMQQQELMTLVDKSVHLASGKIIEGLKTKGWAVVDDFFPSISTVKKLRQEAVSLFKGGAFSVSQSSRYDANTNSLVKYDKHNVFATQLVGGDMYFKAPRLHEYVVQLVSSIVPLLANSFPEADLHPKLASNKLANCVGDGSAYDKHYDNAGLDDLRKVTILLYMNENYSSEKGGQFRIYHPLHLVPELGDYYDVEPIANRLLCFWSDRLVHSVEPSHAPGGEADHRYALTVWLTSRTPNAIARDDKEIKRHFS